jgi:hypothetical protein
MGYFDKVAANYFKETDEGEVIYYPNGALGKGRLVPDEATREALFNMQKQMLQVLFLVVLPYIWIIGIAGAYTLGAFSPVLLVAGYYLYRQHKLTRHLKKHHLRLGFKEAATRGSKVLPDAYYKIMMVFSVLVIILALSLPMMMGVPFEQLFWPVIGISAFGLFGLVLAVKMYQLKKSGPKGTAQRDAATQQGGDR